MACVDAEAGEPRAGRGDVGLALAVQPLAGLDARDEQPVLLELARRTRATPPRGRRARRCRSRPPCPDADGAAPRALGRAPGPRAPRGSRAAAGTRHAAAAGSSSGARRRRRRRAGSRRASGAARAGPGPRGSGSSRSRCPGTRSRSSLADRADRAQRAALPPCCAVVGHGAHRWRKVSRYLPICTSSSSSSTTDSMRLRLTYVPLRLPRSRIVNLSPSATQLGVAARHRDVVEEDVALGRAADQRSAARRPKRLARPCRRPSGRRAPARDASSSAAIAPRVSSSA